MEGKRRHPRPDRLADHAADEGSPELRGRIDRHLERCAECRERMDLLRRLSAAPPFADLTPPDRLLERILASRAESAESEAKVIPLRPVHRRLSPALLRLAAALALFVAGGLAGRATATRDSGSGTMGVGSDGSPAVEAPSPLPETPGRAALRVQRMGSDYIAALSGFRRVAAQADPRTLRQARQVTLAALHGAATELDRFSADSLPDAQLVHAIAQAQERAIAADLRELRNND